MATTQAATRPVVGELGQVARGVLVLRLAAAALSVPALAAAGSAEVLAFSALLGVLGASLIPLLTWRRFEATFLRHPLFLAVDLGLSLSFLSLSGFEAPYLVATLATAFLAGLLYAGRGAAVCSGLLALGVTAISVDRIERGLSDEPVALLAVIVLLFPLLAGAGVGLRRLLGTLQAARDAEAAALAAATAAEERVRLARELHDSVGKTLYGISMSAHALRTVGDETVAPHAEAIEHGARVAATEARELIAELREPPPTEPLAVLLDSLVAGWAERTGIAAVADLRDTTDVAPDVRAEVVAIAAEALENVDRHARADHVEVELRDDAGALVLVVRDDGAGFAPDRPAQARAGGHFGLVGMRERAERVGGQLRVDAAPGEGTTVHLAVPVAATSAPTSERVRAPIAPTPPEVTA